MIDFSELAKGLHRETLFGKLKKKKEISIVPSAQVTSWLYKGFSGWVLVATVLES